MTQSTIINGQIRSGVWHGEIQGVAETTPMIRVTLRGVEIAGIGKQHDAARGLWQISVPILSDTINDGLQTFVIESDGHTLGHFSILVGDGLPDDLQAQVAMLRAELDLLKAAFRKHCAEG